MISRVTKNDFNESAGIRMLQDELERNQRFKTYFYENDKTPNTDGYFEILDGQSVAMKRFVVQIKTVRKMKRLISGDCAYPADSSFFQYVLQNIDQNPAIFFVIDLMNRIVYYKYLSLEYLISLSIGEKRKITLHLTNSDILKEESFFELCKKIVVISQMETSRAITEALLPTVNDFFIMNILRRTKLQGHIPEF